MRPRFFGNNDTVKRDAEVGQLLTGRPGKSSTLSTEGSHDRNGIAAPVIPASPRAAIIRRDGVPTNVTSGSPVSTSRTMAQQYVSAQPLLQELEQLIDRAWADYAAAHARASAAQAASGTVVAAVKQPSPRLTAIATDDPARQEPALAVRPTQPTSTVASEVGRGGKPDAEARAMLRRIDAMLDPFKVADPAPPVQSANTQKLPPTR